MPTYDDVAYRYSDTRLLVYILANLFMYVPMLDTLFDIGNMLDARFSMLYRVVSPVTASVEEAEIGPLIVVVDRVVVPVTDSVPPIVSLPEILDVITLDVVAYRSFVVSPEVEAVESVV